MQENAPQGLNVPHIVAIIHKRKYLILVIALAVVSVATWGSFIWPRTYEARSTVFVEKGSILDPLIKGVGTVSTVEERTQNLKDSLTSRNILERVVKKLDMDAPLKNPGQVEALIEGITRNLTISVKSARDRTIDLFMISYRGGNPQNVRDIVNTLVSEYIEEHAGRRKSDAYSAYEFIEGQLSEYKGKLEQSDKAIRDFREKHPRMVPQTESAVIGRIETLQSTRIESEIRLKELLRKRENLQQQLQGEKELSVAFVTNDSTLQGRLNQLNNQLRSLMSRYTENYPEVIKLKIEIEELKKEIARGPGSQAAAPGTETSAINPVYQKLKEELSRTDFEIESLRARIAEVSRLQQETQTVLGRMPKEQEEWTRLQRDRNVYQKIYDELVQKFENAKVSRDLEVTNKTGVFRVIDPAITPLLPVLPNRVMLILIGLAGGIALGIGTALMLEQFNQSFKEEETVEARLKQPVLAAIPQIVTEADRLFSLRRDRKVFTMAGAYLAVILLVFAEELLRRYLGIKIIHF